MPELKDNMNLSIDLSEGDLKNSNDPATLPEYSDKSILDEIKSIKKLSWSAE